MNETSQTTIENLVQQQRLFFNTHQTKSYDYRIDALQKLKSSILKFQKKIEAALWTDLRKSPEESYLTEISIVIQELDNNLKNLKRWMEPQTVKTPIQFFAAKSKIRYEPLGVSLIIAPFNYPFQLLMNPLIGSIAAGNCALLKPSASAAAIALVMQELIAETFDANYNAVVLGDKPTNEILLKQRFDIIFFTGSTAVGKIIMKAAAENLTPVVLELGGKSPCIVDKNANLDIAAKRIAWGKTINAGQTCIAPDYLLVHEEVKEKLIEKITAHIHKMYGSDVQGSKHYPRIIDENAVKRLEKLMLQGHVIYGGQTDLSDKYVAPTIMDEINLESDLMQEELFGPLLPVITFRNINEAIDFVNSREKPLVTYFFGSNSQAEEILNKTASGGACINDTLVHIANHHLPFGGVGNSGMGKYHGKQSFRVFSNEKSIIYSPTWFDLALKYAPFKYFTFIKRII